MQVFGGLCEFSITAPSVFFPRSCLSAHLIRSDVLRYLKMSGLVWSCLLGVRRVSYSLT